jgi:hypothetical protein
VPLGPLATVVQRLLTMVRMVQSYARIVAASREYVAYTYVYNVAAHSRHSSSCINNESSESPSSHVDTTYGPRPGRYAR